MMRRSELMGWVGTGLLVGMAVACSINPQPLPPDTFDGYDASTGSTTNPINGGQGTGSDATGDAGEAASLDGSPSLNAAGDAGTTGDAAEPEDGGDAGAEDAGDASSEEDAGKDASDAD